jgi:two-component system, cell cycle response regulator
MYRTLGESPVADGTSGARQSMRLRAFQLIRDVQDGAPLEPDEVRQIISDGEANGWPEVIKAGLLLDVVRARQHTGRFDPDTIGRLLDRAVSDHDPVMTATALAMSAQVSPSSEDPAMVAADLDLARATVLLEGAGGETLERSFAHIECAIAYAGRDLWELEMQEYRAVEELPRGDFEEFVLLPVIRFNRAEVQLNWVMALRELQSTESLEQRARTAWETLRAADIPAMPESWRQELQVFGMLLAALAPSAADPAWFDPDMPADGAYAGYVHLTRALTSEHRRYALDEARHAIEAIDREVCPRAYTLALCVTAEIESKIAGSETDGLVYARHLARLRWRSRLSSLASAESLLHAERLRSEHDILSQHVYLDDLTRLGNRRALWRYLDGLAAQGVNQVAVVLIDVDNFKDVNDGHGHAVGDQTLVRLAGLFRAAVRGSDLAVRLGGDEFLLLLAAMQPDAVRHRAEAIRTTIAAEPWSELGSDLHVTVSIGLAFGHPSQHSELTAAADAALYQSKALGGDNVQALQPDQRATEITTSAPSGGCSTYTG